MEASAGITKKRICCTNKIKNIPRNGVGAKIHVVVFDLCRPIACERPLRACADSPACSGFATVRGGNKSITSRRVHRSRVGAKLAESNTTLDVEQRWPGNVTQSAGNGREPVHIEVGGLKTRCRKTTNGAEPGCLL